MNGEWVLQIAVVLIPPLVTAIIGYVLGSRRQKKQILQGHITGIAREEYPSLFDESRKNSEQLDNYLNKPYVTFEFPKLKQLYNTGLEEFIRGIIRTYSQKLTPLERTFSLNTKNLIL